MAANSQLNKHSPATATWGEMLLLPPGKPYGKSSAGIWNGEINYSNELDAEQQETTEAQNPLDVKGGDKQKSFTISVEVNSYATGQNPLAVYNRWIQAIGKSARFYIGRAPIDGSRYILKRVDIDFSNEDIAASGAPFRVFLSLEFVEYTLLRISSQSVEALENENAAAAKKTASKVGPKKAEKKAEAGVFGDTYTPQTQKAKKGKDKVPSVFD